MPDINFDGSGAYRRPKDSWTTYGGTPAPEKEKAAAPTPFSYTGFGSYPWQQQPEGQQFYNSLQSQFPWLSGADLSANLNFDTMPDARFQQSLISNFAAHAPKASTPPTTTNQTTGGSNSGNIQNDWLQWIRGKAPNYQTFRSTLPQLVDEFNKQYGYGIKATGRPDDYDTIQLPDGSIVDVHSSGGDYIWNPEGGGGYSGGATGAGTSQPSNDPLRALYQLLSLKRVGSLGGDPYTTGEDAALRARYMDPLTRARDSRLQQNKEELGRYGYLPSSGLAMHRTDLANRDYEQAVSGAANDTAIQAIGEKNRRQDEQLQILDALLGEGRSYRSEYNGYDQQDFMNAIAQLGATVNASGSGSDFAQMMQEILAIGNANQHAQQMANSNKQATSYAWGQLIPYIVKALGL